MKKANDTIEDLQTENRECKILIEKKENEFNTKLEECTNKLVKTLEKFNNKQIEPEKTKFDSAEKVFNYLNIGKS